VDSMTRRSYRLDEVAAQTGVSVRTLKREIRDGQLVAHRLRGVTVIYPSDLDRYMDGLPTEGSERSAESKPARPSAPKPSRKPGRVVRLVAPILPSREVVS
jgi:excisionase family DNA binding protein